MNHELALALTPKLTSIPSILCSIYILYKVHQDWRDVEKSAPPSSASSRGHAATPVTRAVVGMSCFVVLISTAWFFSTWASPPESGALWAVGNRTTCRMQGFILQLAIGAPMYNAAIILYSVLSILYKWTPEQIRKIEVYVHAFIWTWCLGTATTLLSLDKIHPIGAVCWASDPPECSSDNPPSNCHAKIISASLYCLPLWISLIFTVYGIVRIFWMVHVNHEGLKRLRETSVPRPPASNTRANVEASQNALRRSQDVKERAALLAILYSAAVFVTYTPCIIWSLVQWWDLYPYGVNFMYGLLEPLLGVWNLIIFLLSRKESSQTVQYCFYMVFCCCYIFASEKNFPKDDGTSNVSHVSSGNTTSYKNSTDTNTFSLPGRSNYNVDETPATPPPVLEEVPKRTPSPGSAFGIMITKMLMNENNERKKKATKPVDLPLASPDTTKQAGGEIRVNVPNSSNWSDDCIF